jgi:hypothetical protein
VFPLMLVEFAIGRRGRSNAADAMANVAQEVGASRLWALIGLFGIITAFLILSFYSVIGGWAIAYAVETASYGLAGLNAASAQARFDALMASPARMAAYHLVYMAAVASIVARGVARGIEDACKILMPVLILLIIAHVRDAAARLCAHPGWGCGGFRLLSTTGHRRNRLWHLDVGNGSCVAIAPWMVACQGEPCDGGGMLGLWLGNCPVIQCLGQLAPTLGYAGIRWSHGVRAARPLHLEHHAALGWVRACAVRGLGSARETSARGTRAKAWDSSPTAASPAHPGSSVHRRRYGLPPVCREGLA